MKTDKRLFDIAANEMLLIRKIRRILFNWHIDASVKDGFIGEYLCNLQDIAQTLLFKSMNMTEQMLSIQHVCPQDARTVLAMANDKVAISMGNVEWYMMNGESFDTLWEALHNLKAEAIEEIDAVLMYSTGTIKTLMTCDITHRSVREISDYDLYQKIVSTAILHNKIEKALGEEGISLTYEKGTFGQHAIIVERFLTECLVRVLQLHPETFVDEETWISPHKFTVYYPDEDRDNDTDVSTLDEDIDKLVMFMDTEGVPEKIWDAFINRDKYAVMWLRQNTTAHIGPVEEEEINGEA